MARRGATALCGILPLDKPAGMTSHDVVAIMRRATGEKRIGHAGTLDPAATGLLVVLIGPATRLEPYLSGAIKAYRATIAFGTETDTDDAEGAVVRTAEVPTELFDPATAQAALDAFLGESLQRPPAYSAIKVGGRTAHRVARGGGEIELAPRRIDVLQAELLGSDPDARTWDVSFVVSKGTYIRALARDIGLRADSAAHLSGLRRTASGPLTLDDASSLEDAARLAEAGEIGPLLADPVLALGSPPVTQAPNTDITSGRTIPRPPGLADGVRVAVLNESGEFAALYRATGDVLKPDIVLAVPIRRNA